MSKMSKKNNKSQNLSQSNSRKKRFPNSLQLIKETLTLIGGLAGSILAVYGLIKTFKDDSEGFTWLIFIGILVWLIFLFKLFQVRKTAAYWLFIVSIFLGTIGWIGWQSQVTANEKKVIVLVAQFDGPEDTYGLQQQIMEDLQAATKNYDDTLIVESDKIISSSELARELGEKINADIVIWAWYRPTENPNITIHVENLSRDFSPILKEGDIYQPKAEIQDLESFEIQKKVGAQTKKLISLLMGYIRLKSNDCETALPLLNEALVENEAENLINKKDVLSFSGYCYAQLRQYENAIRNYDEIILETPTDIYAYIDRGVSYFNLGDNENAIENFDKAVELAPKLTDPYTNRAYFFYFINDTTSSLADINTALTLDANNIYAYLIRANIYEESHQFELALQDLNKVIEIAPKNSVGYNNKGGMYVNLGQYNNAIKEFNKALKLDPYNATSYNNRGYAYAEIGKYKQAISDYTSAINLDPKYPTPYRNRSNAYKNIGEFGKAVYDLEIYKELTDG